MDKSKYRKEWQIQENGIIVRKNKKGQDKTRKRRKTIVITCIKQKQNRHKTGKVVSENHGLHRSNNIRSSSFATVANVIIDLRQDWPFCPVVAES